MHIKYHSEIFHYSFFNFSIFALCFRSTILFWLRMTVFKDDNDFWLSNRISRILSVNRFCDKFNVTICPKYGRIFATP